MNRTEHKPILTHWPGLFRDASIVDRHFGFSGALVLRIDVGGQHFALRKWPQGTLPERRLTGLHQLLRFVQERGIETVSVPVPTTAGPTYARHADYLWQLEPWMPGTADFHDHPTDARLRAAMQSLARFHLAAAEFRCNESSSPWFSIHSSSRSPAIEERLRFTEQWLSTGLTGVRQRLGQLTLAKPLRQNLESILSAFAVQGRDLHAELQTLRSATFRLQPALRDIWHDHLLFQQNRVSGLIDASACRTENPVIDISRLLISFNVPEKTALALESYEQVRPLSPAEHLLRAAFDRTQILLAGLTWVDRFLAGQIKPHDLARVEQRVDEIVAGQRRFEFGRSP